MLRISRVVVLTVAVMSVPAFISAQGLTGTVSGTVTDQRGGVVPNTTVKLVSESTNTASTPVSTNSTGDFVFPNMAAGTYTVVVEVPSFKTLRHPHVEVAAGSRVSVGRLALEIGATSQVIEVTAETPLVQTASGERSFTVTTESVTSLPVAGRSYDALLGLAPGIDSSPGSLVPAARSGGGGFGMFMIDGVSQMDPAVNRPTSRVNVESIAEVTVQTSGYQAEYGRASGLQINAVTKSGTNKFHGAMYDVERHSQWNSNSRFNILSGNPKAYVDERDWGGALGGPVGKQGGSNKLFFYVNYERNPRVFNQNTVIRYRMPTARERAGDFSQSLDNNGNLFNLIKNPTSTSPCTATNAAGCFADGGVLGKIPPSLLYPSGLAILNWYPNPNMADTPGLNYNYQALFPGQNEIGTQLVARVDYQPTKNLHASFRYFAYLQPNDVVLGTLPGWDDSKQDNSNINIPGGMLDWTVNPRTFVEVSAGANWNHREGCSLLGGAPVFCQHAASGTLVSTDAVSQAANRLTNGMGNIPYIFPNATVIDPSTYYYGVLQSVKPSFWDGTRYQAPPQFSFGTRVANQPPYWAPRIDGVMSHNINVSVTRVQGRHTIKAGYYYNLTQNPQGTGLVSGSVNFGNNANNPLDTGFGFANAALGVFSTYQQQSRFNEALVTAINKEAYVQDNWKVTGRWTLDYGIRLVDQAPIFDQHHMASNFIPAQYSASSAPKLYVAGCAVATLPCPTASLQAMNPVTGALLGANTSILVGTLVPNTGNALNGIVANGQGTPNATYTSPVIALAPRFGTAWDVRGNHTLVLRGGLGLFYDRASNSAVFNASSNPPFTQTATVNYGNLANMAATGLATVAPPALAVMQYDEPLPASVQWNGGVQMAIPFSTVVDVSYVGQHSYNFLQSVNVNSIDLGAAFLARYQNPVQSSPAAPTNPTTSYVNTNPDIVRFYQGYNTIAQQQSISWRTYHSVQVSVTRRFSKGLSFGFYDTLGVYDRQNSAPRLQHNPDGTITLRSDQALADQLLGDNHPRAHVMKSNWVWQLPKIRPQNGMAMRAVRLLANDWSFSGIWSGSTGGAYALSASYQNGGGNVNLTGSPDYTPRVVLAPGAHPGGGCNKVNLLQQFNPAAFQGPPVGSTGLESGNGYLKGCFISQFDVAIARSVRLGEGRQLQLRIDLFNALNQGGITAVNTTMNLNSPTDPVTVTNLPIAATATRTSPVTAGFGVANNFQAPRTVQVQLRLQF